MYFFFLDILNTKSQMQKTRVLISVSGLSFVIFQFAKKKKKSTAAAPPSVQVTAL